MLRLLDLPNETLLQITTSTHVDDINSFASCSKHMRLLFGPVLQLHMERKRKYSRIGLGRPHSQIRSPHAIMLLRDIFESPAITLYPADVVIGDCEENLEYWPDWSEWHHEEGKAEISEAIAQCSGVLSAKLDGCPYIEKSDKPQWKEEICAGNEYTAVAFLIRMLPNVKSITISDATIYPDRLVEIVSKIAAAQRIAPEIFHPLQKLDTVRLERCSNNFEACYDIFEPFAELPSVRTLAGRKVEGWDCDWSGQNENTSDDEDEDEDQSQDAAEDDRLEDDEEDGHDVEGEDEYEYEIVESGGGITHIVFQDSAIDSQSFNLVLRGTEALRKFQYNYDNLNFSRVEGKWEPAAILRSLLFYAGHSLVFLDLTGNDGSWDICVGGSPYFANSPRHFQVLKQLYVQEGIFLEEMDVLQHPLFVDMPWKPTKRTTWRNYRMVDMLPASLEQLTLFPSSIARNQMPRAFDGFPELKAERLPRLKEITLAYGLQVDEGTKQACKKVGTSVRRRPRTIPRMNLRG